MNTIIETRALSRRFGKNLAVANLTMKIPSGRICALLGPNGAGKTTTIKMLMNMIRPSGGHATVLGTESDQLGPKELSRIGYVSENQELPGWMKVWELIDYCQPMYPSWDEDLCDDLVQLFDLPLTQKIKSLSRGVRMKVALLVALAYRPELVILDEPFTGLDPLVRDEFIRGLLELSGRTEWTVLIASHDIDEVERLVDWVCVMDRGALRVSESTAALEDRFRQCELTLAPGEQLPDPVPDSWLTVESSGQRVRFVVNDYREQAGEAEIRKAVPGLQEMTVNRMSLKAIFMSLARHYRQRREVQT